MKNQEMDESYLEKISRAQKHMLRASELVNKFGSPTQSEWTCDTPDTIPSRHISIMKMTPPIIQNISEIKLTFPMFHVTKSIYRVVEHGKIMLKQFKKPGWIPYENLAVQSDKSTFVRTTKDKHFVWADEFSLSAEQKNFSYELKQYVSLFDYLSRNITNVEHVNEDEDLKMKKMKGAARAYVEANKDVKELLESTGSYELIYFTDTDNEWGIRWDKNGKVGKNMLGKIFMSIRNSI